MRTVRALPRASRPVAAAVAGVLVMTACAGDGEDGVGERPVAGRERATSLVLATGSPGGTSFPLGDAIAAVWEDAVDGLEVTTRPTGGSVENVGLLDAGEVDLALAGNGVAADARAGEREFAGRPHDLAFVGSVHREVGQVVARSDAGVAGVEDLQGRRVALGPPGSGTEVLARRLLEAGGLDPDGDVEAFRGSFDDAADRLRDGSLDAAVAILALPATSIGQVASTTDLDYVSLEDDLVRSLVAGDPTLAARTVEAGTYPGQDDEVTWVANWVGLYASPALDERVVHDLTRVLYERRDAVAAAHPVGSRLALEDALAGRVGVPLHPGARRYYEEVGLE